MNIEIWQQVETVLDKIIELDTIERDAFLQKMQGSSPLLYKHVSRLLDAMDKAEDTQFMESSFSENSRLLDELKKNRSLNPALKRMVGKKVGHFILTDFLGRGGMAVVYRGERQEGSFNQTVAVKILYKNIYSEESILRFRAEQQILSKMNHTNIAHLIDGGFTDEGNPYLIMEYVNGKPIDVYYKNTSCDINEKLALFKDLCTAVKYAHRNMVVHRDLKPANIYVTTEGKVKVLDFSIAKLLDSNLALTSLIETQTGVKLLSPSYCAPEQFQNSAITTSTDVFALGLLLYELMTGQKAVSSKEKTLTEIESTICNTEFKRPRYIEPNIDTELEAIILKALRKEPEYRYDSAGQMLEDLERYEKSLPLLAREDTFKYRTNKFVKRNLKTVIFTLVFLSVISALGAFHYYQIGKERDIAKQEARRAQMATSFMVDMFNSADPVDNIDDTLTVYDLLGQGRNKIDELNDQPSLQIDLLLSLGESFQNIGDYEKAEPLLKKADSLSGELFDEKSLEVAKSSKAIGDLYSIYRQYDNSKIFYEKSFKAYNSQTDQYWSEKAEIMSDLGYALQRLGQPDSAEILFTKALNIGTTHDASASDLLSLKSKLAMNYRIQHRYNAAETIYRQILTKLDEFEESRYDTRISTLNNLGYLLKVQKRYDDAKPLYLEALKLHKKIYGKIHNRTLMLENNLASLYSEEGNFEKAREIRERVVALSADSYGPNHWRTGRSYSSLGGVYFKEKQFDKAFKNFKKSYQIYKQSLGAKHLWTANVALYTHFSAINADEVKTADFPFSIGYNVLKANRDSFSQSARAGIQRLISNVEKHGSLNRSEEIDKLKALIKE